MTLIGAKQINKKWTLFTDDCVTIWQSQVSAARQYRPKLREMSGKNCNLVIASCWWTREVDLILNLLQAKLETNKIKDTIWLWYVIQTTLVEAFKMLNEIAKDPSVGLLILETNSNTLWHTDDYSMFQPQDNAEIVAWSWEQWFMKALKIRWGFCDSFIDAVVTDEYCQYPIYAYRDWEMYEFYPYQKGTEMYEILTGIRNKDGTRKESTSICGETATLDEWGNCWEVCSLLSRSGLSSQTSTKLW